MNFDMTKIANVILYLMSEKVKHLNDRKLSIMLFLMDYNHLKHCGKKIFADDYIKDKREPKALVLGELFEIIANGEDLEDDDERLYLIQELLTYLDIEVIDKERFIELQFIKMEEEFDAEQFSKDEMKTIQRITNKYRDMSPRNIANACFEIDEVRECRTGDVII